MKPQTLFLKLVLALVALVTIVVALIPVPIVLRNIVTHGPQVMLVPGILFGAGLYLLILAFLVAVWFAERLLQTIDRGAAFSQQALQGLTRIKWCVATMTCGALMWLPLIYTFAQWDDAPGVVLIGGAIVAIPVVITVFLAILQRLWAAALTYKEANDLTI